MIIESLRPSLMRNHRKNKPPIYHFRGEDGRTLCGYSTKRMQEVPRGAVMMPAVCMTCKVKRARRATQHLNQN